MSPQELISEISSGHFRPAYYFFGREDYRITEAEKYVAKAFLPSLQVLTNYDKIDGKRIKKGELMARLAAFPMLGERQVISISEIQSFKPKEVDQITRLLKPGDPNRIVIFSSPSARSPKPKSAFVRKMLEVVSVVEFQKLSPDEARRLIVIRLRKAGIEIDPQALDAMVTLLDGNRGALDQELAKLIDYLDGQERATLDDVDLISSGYQTSAVFDLADQVVSGDTKRVLTTVRQFLAEGSSATGMLYFLGQHFISLYLVKSGKPLESNRRWLANRYRSQAGKYSQSRLANIIEAIAGADSELRRQSLPTGIILDRLIVGLMQPDSTEN